MPELIKDRHPQIRCFDPESGENLIDRFLCRELDLKDVERFTEHLRSCHACSIQVVNLSVFIDWLKEAYRQGIN